MSIRSIIQTKGSQVETIAASEPAQAAAGRMREKKIAALIVTEGNAIAGIVSEREIVHALSVHGAAVLTKTVRDMMATYIVTVDLNDTMKRAMNLMTQRRVRHLLVKDGGAIAGIISIGDVVKHRIDDLEMETNVLRDAYIAVH